jgi:type IV secretory pathway VirD2 relaxase
VKVSYTKNRQSGAWYAHGRYLSRPGAQREDERGLGFDFESEEIEVPKRLSAWQRDGDPRLWKMIVSPENGDRLDLNAHTRQLVDRVERDLGRRLEWVAIDHHDTAHPHVHLLIRGVDREGHPLLLHRDYIRFGFRRRSQEIATRELGLRREREPSRPPHPQLDNKHEAQRDHELEHRRSRGPETPVQQNTAAGLERIRERDRTLINRRGGRSHR